MEAAAVVDDVVRLRGWRPAEDVGALERHLDAGLGGPLASPLERRGGEVKCIDDGTARSRSL